MDSTLVTLREYAKNKNVSYEAIRKQVQRYKDHELKDHIIKQGKTQYLDTFAIEFLDERRKENPIIVLQSDKDEEIQRLSNENKMLLLKITELQDALLIEKDTVKALQEEKIALLEAKAEPEPEQPKKKPFWSRWKK